MPKPQSETDFLASHLVSMPPPDEMLKALVGCEVSEKNPSSNLLYQAWLRNLYGSNY